MSYFQGKSKNDLSMMQWTAMGVGLGGCFLSLFLGDPIMVISIFIGALFLPGIDIVINGFVFAVCLSGVILGVEILYLANPKVNTTVSWIGIIAGGFGAICTVPWILSGILLIAMSWASRLIPYYIR